MLYYIHQIKKKPKTPKKEQNSPLKYNKSPKHQTTKLCKSPTNSSYHNEHTKVHHTHTNAKIPYYTNPNTTKILEKHQNTTKYSKTQNQKKTL